MKAVKELHKYRNFSILKSSFNETFFRNLSSGIVSSSKNSKQIEKNAYLQLLKCILLSKMALSVSQLSIIFPSPDDMRMT